MNAIYNLVLCFVDRFTTNHIKLNKRKNKNQNTYPNSQNGCADLQQAASKQATSSYSLHLADTTAGIDDIIPSPQTTQLSGSKKDARGLYLAVPTTGTHYIICLVCLDRCTSPHHFI